MTLSFPFHVSCCPPGFKQGQAERLQAMKAQTKTTQK